MNATEFSRLTVTNLMKEVTETGQDVVEGLTAEPKFIPPKYFYDEKGSQLFEQICELPEYYPTRTETAVLRSCAAEIIKTTGPCELVELGSGSSTKTRILFEAYQAAKESLHYIPVDVSDTMLIQSAQALLQEYPQMTISALASTYEPALDTLPEKKLPTRMIAFLGSTIGNLPPDACDRFLARIAQALSPGDFFLLGIDLQKDISVLETAYNDGQSITAAFNLNMLNHLNRKFDGDFNPQQFSHVAQYNSQAHQIEMYLESLVEQTITLNALNLSITLKKKERILSEISRKFNTEKISKTLHSYDLPVINVFTDPKHWFALLLCQRA